MALAVDNAICIRVWDWSETSQTVSLFARTHGVVRCVAKGAKRDKSNYSGGLEVMSVGEMTASLKRGDQLSVLTAWDLRELIPAARRSLSAFHHGLAMLDVTRHALEPLDPHPALYDALLDALRRLGDPRADRLALLTLLWASLDETGHRPEIFVDVHDGRPLAAGAVQTFFPRAGGLSGTTQDGPAWRVRSETLDVLRLVASGVVPDHASTPPEVAGRAVRLLAHYFREVFSVEPPALAGVTKEGT